jgi:phage terminase large subunit
MLIPTIREDGSEFWINFNPDMEDDPVYDRFILQKGRSDVEAIKINYKDNPYFPNVLQAELEWDKRTNYDKYLHIWEGETRQATDVQVFRGKYRVGTFETPADVVYYYGADWGFSQDPTVLLRCFIRNGILWIDQEAYGVGVDIDKTPELFRRVPDSEKWWITGDSARPETISYLRQHGFPKIRGAIKAKGSVEDGIEFIKSFEGVFIHERCKHTADEFKMYSYQQDRLTGEPLPKLEDKHNHAIDALRYALEKVMMRHGTAGNIGMEDLGL